MFDLKAKLLNIGLVTKEQVQKVEKEKIRQQKEAVAKPVKSIGDFQTLDREKSLTTLKSLKKAEQYITIRKWVEINRLDKPFHGGLECEKFFIPSADQVTWLTLKKEIIEQIKDGNAGVVGFMSNYGYAHAVVPRDIAEDIGEVFPEWLKVLNKT